MTDDVRKHEIMLFSKVPAVRAELLVDRIHLERRMLKMLGRVCFFATYAGFFLFLCASILPPEQTSAVHRRLGASLGLAQAEGVGSAGAIYAFLTDIAKRHTSFEAMTQEDWCEERFLSLEWDFRTSSARQICTRPNLQPFVGTRRLSKQSEQPLHMRSLSENISSEDNSSVNTTTPTPSSTTSTTTAATVGLSIMIENIDYAGLSANGSLALSFKEAIKTALETSIVDILARAREIKVDLSAGSVKASITIVPFANASTRALTYSLQQGTDKVESAVLSEIIKINGIQSVKTGSMSVTVTEISNSEVIPACFDDDKELSVTLGRQTTCNMSASEVCSLDIGLTLCPATCILCGPFRYKRLNKFIGPQVSILPMLVHQSRFKEKGCSGFAEKYAMQPTNPDQFYRPALDGVRSGRLTNCIDRTERLSSAYAKEVPCKAGSADACVDGIYYDTPSHTFLGETVYPVLFSRPSVNIEQMKAIQWLDAQTGTVAIELLVYTEGLDISTLVSVSFTFDEAGNVEPKVQMRSWKDMKDEHKSIIVATAVLAASCALAAILHSMWYLRGLPVLKASDFFEVIGRFMLAVVALSVMAWRLQRPSVGEKYQSVLRTQAKVEDITSREGSQRGVEAFLGAAHLLHESAEELDVIHLILFITVLIQGVQALIYFHAHPRTAVLSATMQRAMERLCYLAVLFVPFFFFLAFLAFWMFGFRLVTFANFGQALTSQLRMLYGDFLRAPGVPGLGDADAAMYWIHAVVFLVSMFLVFRFVFLAVVIDAFLEAKAERPPVACSAPFDLVDSLFAVLRWRRGSSTMFSSVFWGLESWSDQDVFLEWLEAWPSDKVLTTADFEEYFSSDSVAQGFQLYYTKKVPAIIYKPVDEKRKKSGSLAQAVDSAVPNMIRPKLDPERVAKRVVHEVTCRLAERDLKDVDRFVTIGRVACAITREFRDVGLVPGG
eukprot:TRINITY_DN19397_c0_g1_i1.p1 TRINITY_DN19397_c0_g1~~TRINITY_DN19397_c0_g1_i1.p1  ORF type:complete len:951 (+),score=136.76 TRINITY_DN19397_c0_g1_i1:59-2911(+)